LASREQAPAEREDDMASDLNQLPRVLIVDDSRMVRATLIKHIRSHYDYREEGDGEAAWQVVVLDHAIQAIICDLSMPVLDGFGLLARIRNSRLARIRQLPVIMISGDEDEASRERAKALGVSDFIMKGAGATELLSRLESLIRLTHTERELEKNKDQQVQDPDTGLFTRKYIELQAAQALSHASRHNSEVSVMLLGFDRFDGLRVDAGEELAKQLQLRFAKLVAGKIRKEDSLGHFDDKWFAVVSPGTPEISCGAFGNRLREAIEVANVAAHGHRLKLSVSIGVANSPTDAVTSAGALLEMAAQRLQMAMDAGGNQLVGTSGKVNAVAPPPTIVHALDLLRSGHANVVRPHTEFLLAELMPLLELFQEESGIDLPLAALKERFSDRT
jgi:diguanylate cyclase (GGDEF)-like protein